MATGGETVYSCCSSCLDDGRNVVARHYCVDCEMYFCSKCVKPHNKIFATKKHHVNDVNVSDPTEADDDTKSLQSNVPSGSVQGLRCTLHQGKRIDTFCKDHNEVCCGSCAMVKHRLCSTVPIAVAAKDFKTSPERNECNESLSINLIKLNEEKDKREENLDSIGKQKLELIENVDKYEEKMIERIKELANNSRREIRSKHDEHKETLDMDIGTIDVAITTNKEYTEQLDKRDEELQFIYMKANKTVTKDEEMLLQAMTTDYMGLEIRYCFDETLESHVGKMKSFGILNEECALKGYSATFQRNINIKQSDDRKDTYVRGICLMESGELLVTDDDNCKLKRFDSNFQFKDEIKFGGCPVAVCKIDEHEVAVRIWDTKFVHIVAVGQTMQFTSFFTLANNGWGMTYDAGTGEILACEDNKVSAYDKASGNKVRTYDKDTNGEKIFSYCRQIALSQNRQDIYVTDQYESLIVLDINGTLKRKVSIQGISHTWPLCLLPGDIILVGCNIADVIAQVYKDEKQIGNLIDTGDGREYTYCVVYDSEHSRLIIGGYPSVLSVYTMAAKYK